MKKISHKIEMTAIILFFVLAVVLEVVIFQKYFLSDSTTADRPPENLQPRSNSPIKISGVDFSEHQQTLVIALQKGCHFCTSSVPFYKRLIENVQDKNIKLVAILPDKSEDARDYLDKMGLTSLEAKHSSLSNLRVRGTPTLILVNEKGEVTNQWLGKLNTAKEDEVIKSL